LERDTGSLKSELFCKISERKSDGDDVNEKRLIETLLNSKQQTTDKESKSVTIGYDTLVTTTIQKEGEPFYQRFHPPLPSTFSINIHLYYCTTLLVSTLKNDHRFRRRSSQC
jgi:hypothetical protein